MNIPILIAERYPIHARFLGGDETDLQNLEWNDSDNERPSDEEFQQAWAEIEPIVESSKKSMALAQTDTDFIRVTEDLIDVLIEKSVIALEDLPQSAQDKYNERKTLRS